MIFASLFIIDLPAQVRLSFCNL